MIRLVGLITATAGTIIAAGARAALPIDLEVVVEAEAPLGAMQEWGRVLGGMDLARLRLRGARRGDHAAIAAAGEGAARRYVVTALVTRGNELLLDGAKFRQVEGARLKQFLAELPERFEEAGVVRGPFGLKREQFEALIEELALPVPASSLGTSPGAVIATLDSRSMRSIELDYSTEKVLRAAKPCDSELKGLSTGTALAAMLRSSNLALAAEAGDPGPSPKLRIVSLSDISGDECWPVGWKPAKSPRLLAPAMFKLTTVEIDGYTLATALEALAPHIGVPLVYDERTLAARGIDPAKVQVKLPAGKTYILKAVERILSQARLAGELRVDEAGTPFYWITKYGKGSERAVALPVWETGEER